MSKETKILMELEFESGEFEFGDKIKLNRTPEIINLTNSNGRHYKWHKLDVAPVCYDGDTNSETVLISIGDKSTGIRYSFGFFAYPDGEDDPGNFWLLDSETAIKKSDLDTLRWSYFHHFDKRKS